MDVFDAFLEGATWVGVFLAVCWLLSPVCTPARLIFEFCCTRKLTPEEIAERKARAPL